MNQFDSDDLYVKNIEMPTDLLNLLNQELNEYGIAGAWNFLCFKRKNFFTKTLSVHKDYSLCDGEVHSSIVLPIEGCAGTYMYWLDGKYVTERKIVAESHYLSVIWKELPHDVGQVEINHEPMLTRVDVPHGVVSRKDGSYRTILSIRLLDNPDFDEIIEKRFDNKS
jgi:hypothetical protein